MTTTPPESDSGISPTRQDRGTSFIEMLVAIVLLGLAVIATLTAVRTTVISSDVSKEHANGHAWLQAAADAVHAADYEECDGTPGEAATIAGLYESSAEFTSIPVPADWSSGATIDITDVNFWSVDITGSDAWGDTCQSSAAIAGGVPRNLQQVIIQVTSPDGDMVKSVEVIRGA